MDTVVRNLRVEPSGVGHESVLFSIGGRQAAVSPYMLLDHMFFRTFLDAQGTADLREFLRCYYSAIGERILSGPHSDTNANAEALFGSSESLQALSALGTLIKAAEANRWSVMLDG